MSISQPETLKLVREAEQSSGFGSAPNSPVGLAEFPAGFPTRNLAQIPDDDLALLVRDSFLKFAQVIPHIVELRARFRIRPRGKTILDCKTWTEFCERVLHRTDRGVRKAIAAAQPKEVEKAVVKKIREEVRSSYAPTDEGIEYLRDLLNKISFCPPRDSVGSRAKRVPLSTERRLFSKSEWLAAEEIIDTGYKTLAIKRHPDHGGSAEQMVALNTARVGLRRILIGLEDRSSTPVGGAA
jgi:hypothetical protein